MNDGIHYDIPFEQYRAIEAVNSSLLWTLRERTACHAKWNLDHPSEPTEALEFGRIFHLAILEPALFSKTVRVLPEDAPRKPNVRQRTAAKPSPATVEAIKWWDDWEQDVAETITSETMAQLEAMQASVRRTQCKQYVTGGRSEVTIIWTDPVTGMRCKGRADYVQDAMWGTVLTDVKSTRDASEAGFKKSIYWYGYFMQAAYYAEGWKVATGERPMFAWVAVEKQTPYCSKAWEADEDTMEAGRKASRVLLNQWAECVKTDTYPAYGDDVELIQLEEWQLRREGVNKYEVHAI